MEPLEKFLYGLSGALKMVWNPQKRRKLQQFLEQMKMEGVDPANRTARRAWVRTHRQELRPLIPKKAVAVHPSRPASKIGRNDPCPCESGKKFKKCCGLE